MVRRWQTVWRHSDVLLAGLMGSGRWVTEAPEYAPDDRTNLETPAPPAPSSTCAKGREGGKEGVTNRFKGAGRLWKQSKPQQRGRCS